MVTPLAEAIEPSMHLARSALCRTMAARRGRTRSCQTATPSTVEIRCLAVLALTPFHVPTDQRGAARVVGVAL